MAGCDSFVCGGGEVHCGGSHCCCGGGLRFFDSSCHHWAGHLLPIVERIVITVVVAVVAMVLVTCCQWSRE